jgi:hypothetical protein
MDLSQLNEQETNVYNLNYDEQAVIVLRKLISEGFDPAKTLDSGPLLEVSYDAHDTGQGVDIVRAVRRRHRIQGQRFLLHYETVASMSVDGAVALVNDLVTVIARS